MELITIGKRYGKSKKNLYAIRAGILNGDKICVATKDISGFAEIYCKEFNESLGHRCIGNDLYELI